MMTAGLLFAALSAFFNGTFGVFTKMRRARRVHPLVTNYWIAEGVGLSGLLLLALPPRVFSPWGLLSGVLFVLSAAHAVSAIALIGLAVASGVWCGTAVISSFAYGVLVAGDEVEHLGRALAGIAVILAGISGIAAAAWMGDHGLGGAPAAAGEDSERAEGQGSTAADPLLEPTGAADGGHAPGAATPHSLASTAADEPPPDAWQLRLRPRARALLGLLAAVVAGGVGGLILAPMLAAPEEVRGLQFVPSMAAGALLLAPVTTTVLTGTFLSAPVVSFVQATSSRAAAPGMAAGICWNLGNVCCIMAVTDPHVGMAVALPIMQAGLFVAGCWGIALHREIRGKLALAAYFVSGAALVAGAAVLAGSKE